MKIKWSKIFDWSVTGIQAPYMLAGTADVMDAYCVEVFFRHHGQRRFSFPVTRDRWLISGRELAHQRATQFYNKMRQKIRHGAIPVRTVFEIKCNEKSK